MVEFTRLVVTPEQIRRHRLPTAPPKATDRRSFAGETTQAEALPPDILARIVEDAITDRLDRDQLDNVLAAEEAHRLELRALLDGLGGAS